MLDDLIEQKAAEQMSRASFLPQYKISHATAVGIIHALKHKGFHLVALDTRQYTKWIMEAERKIPATRQKTTKQEREAKRIAGVRARAKNRRKK